jgi:hypothetical protein
MTTPSQPTTTQATPSQWQVPASNGTDYQILPGLQARFVALVAALFIQATVALLGVLPGLPIAPNLRDLSDGYYTSYSQPVSFWIQFAVIEFLAAVVISIAFGPGVRFGDVPAMGQLVLGLGFVVLPATALVLGGIDAAQAAAKVSPAVAASSWLSTATFGTLFFGLPLLALAAPTRRATVGRAG